ncbi:MAG: hypothetical protein D3906_08635 [Candidatus Electrothrix sp. AUS1_2]|nr:hypothetical protein [Candidatus Electrothrix sp. AUS1_2]
MMIQIFPHVLNSCYSSQTLPDEKTKNFILSYYLISINSVTLKNTSDKGRSPGFFSSTFSS